MRRVYFGLGSNLGDRAGNLAQAVRALREVATIGPCSSVWETAPMHVLDQPSFFNMVVAGATTMAPLTLLERIKTLETTLGRRPSIRFGPRLIDIDLLIVEGVMMDTEILTLPHPRLADRRFVLAPLAEIAAGMIEPRHQRSVAALLAALPPGDEVCRLGALEVLAPGLATAL